MIVKMAHIGCCTDQTELVSQALRLSGFQKVFAESSLPNMEIKRKLLGKWAPRQSLHLWEHPCYVGVELVDYGFSPMDRMAGIGLCWRERQDWMRSQGSVMLGALAAQQAFIADTGIRVWYGVEGFSRDGVILLTAELAPSLVFWAQFGLRIEQRQTGWARMRFPSPFAPEREFLMIEDKTAAIKPRLDLKGFNCLAFFSTALERDHALLKQAGARVTEVEPLVVGGKMLNLFFVQGPSNEIVEVLGLAGSPQ